jgi:hypothetical protein
MQGQVFSSHDEHILLTRQPQNAACRVATARGVVRAGVQIHSSVSNTQGQRDSANQIGCGVRKERLGRLSSLAKNESPPELEILADFAMWGRRDLNSDQEIVGLTSQICRQDRGRVSD